MAGLSRTNRRTTETRTRRTSRTERVAIPVQKREARTYERTSPPVMVRTPAGSMPGMAKRRPQKARRRYDMALGSTGAEIRLPALPQISFGWRLVSFVMSVALGFLIYHLWNSPAYRVDEPQIQGLQRVDSREVAALLDVGDEPVFVINPQQLADKLSKSFPEFSAVSVQVALPDTVVVSVTERVPVLTWKEGGRTELVDSSGVAFPIRNEDQALPSPVVEASGRPSTVGLPESQPDGTGPQYLLKPEMVNAVLAMATQSPANTPLVYDARHGLGWKDARGWEVYFGDMQDMQMKLDVYKAIINRLEKKEIQPALVSVEYVHAPYYRLEK